MAAFFVFQTTIFHAAGGQGTWAVNTYDTKNAMVNAGKKRTAYLCELCNPLRSLREII